MCREKTFGYKFLTETAEKRIAKYMEKSRASKDARDRLMYSDWAYGVFACWSAVTTGWQENGDAEKRPFGK